MQSDKHGEGAASEAFSRSMNSLEGIANWFKEYAMAYGLPEPVRYAVDLTLEELFSNMVKYNPRGAPHILIRITRDGPMLQVLMVDSGEAFDITAAREVDTSRPMEERRPGGLGIHLVRSMMDEIAYRYVDGRNEITLYKKVE